MQKQDIIKAGEIASKVKEFAKSFIKKDTSLLEIAEKIESKIKELGGTPGFPTNLSINDIAAHYTPTYDDETLAHGLLKIDLGVHINGWLADTSFSLDLENNNENKKLIQAAEESLQNVLKIMKKNISTDEIGKEVQRTMMSHNTNPIVNLSGHSMDQYDLHAGITIPNINDKKNIILKKGLYAIEPFSTNGNGKVYDGKPSEIYLLVESKNVRSPLSREVLTFIIDSYGSLPFCSRWIVKEFGTKGLLALKQLKEQGNLHQFPQLVESSHSKVAQAEDTVLIDGDDVIITTQ